MFDYSFGSAPTLTPPTLVIFAYGVMLMADPVAVDEVRVQRSERNVGNGEIQSKTL